MLLQAGEQLTEPGLVLRQRLVENPLARAVQSGRLMFGFPDIQPAENGDLLARFTRQLSN